MSSDFKINNNEKFNNGIFFRLQVVSLSNKIHERDKLNHEIKKDMRMLLSEKTLNNRDRHIIQSTIETSKSDVIKEIEKAYKRDGNRKLPEILREDNNE